MPSIGMGSIFTIGSTAALAWQLPHDPLVPFRKPADVLHRSDNDVKAPSGTLQYDQHPEPVNILKTYYNPFLVDKTPAINSVNYWRTGDSGLRRKSYIGNNRWSSNAYSQQEYKRKRYEGYEPINTYMDPVYHQVHRRTRRDLYGKLESLFTALSKDGKACLLKAVCEVSQAPQSKGTFMEEIIKVVFRVKPHDEYQDEDKYDIAYNKNHNCTEMYPSCEHSVWTSMF